MEIPHEFFLNTPGNSTFCLIDLWNFHMLFLQYLWKFHVLKCSMYDVLEQLNLSIIWTEIAKLRHLFAALFRNIIHTIQWNEIGQQ